jgi:hypothetical protein
MSPHPTAGRSVILPRAVIRRYTTVKMQDVVRQLETA